MSVIVATAKNQDAPTTPAPNELSEAIVRRRTALARFAISITILNILGHTLLGFEQPTYVPVLAVLVSYAAALLFESLDAWARKRKPEFAGGGGNLIYFLLPGHIAALAASMLLYADNTAPYIFAVLAAASSKYIFRVRVGPGMRHYLNPSNFGIALTLLLNPTVGFAPPYMFLNDIDQPFDWLIPAGILMLGTMLNAGLTRKMPLIAAWVGGYILQGLLRWAFLGDNPMATLALITGVPFVLYTNYMITDPGTTPSKPRNQVVFGLTLAAVYGILIASQISYAIFFALIVTCFLRGAMLWLSNRRSSPPATPTGAA